MSGHCIPPRFIRLAVDMFGDTEDGLSGSSEFANVFKKLVEKCRLQHCRAITRERLLLRQFDFVAVCSTCQPEDDC